MFFFPWNLYLWISCIKNIYFFIGVQRTRWGTCHWVWYQIHGNICQSFHKCWRSIFYISKRHQVQNGKTTGKYEIFFSREIALSIQCLLQFLNSIYLFFSSSSHIFCRHFRILQQVKMVCMPCVCLKKIVVIRNFS